MSLAFGRISIEGVFVPKANAMLVAGDLKRCWSDN
jgi:hypothetical protein